MSEILNKAREYEKEESAKIVKENRPVFHFSTPVGWLNDPNGFSDYKGEHHLFFQYYPYGTYWGPMHWGHTKSKDFIKWEYLPAALAPDEDYDNFGVFSGSAIEDGGEQILVYTAVEERKEGNKKLIRQTQCIAVGDGMNYRKHKNNPVIKADLLPEGSSLEDFRDPKIWKEDDRYYMVVGSRNADGSGQIALFSAEKPDEWKFEKILDKSENKVGRMWECPDFFNLSEKQILIISPQEMEAEGLEFHAGNNALFLVGSYEKENFNFTREKIQSADYGLDFYAPQTLLTEDGRRVMTGWMQSWDNPIYPANHSWSGMMTLPRELFYKNERVCQLPVREIEAYRKNEAFYGNICIEEERELAGISGRSLDLELSLKGNEYKKFRMKLVADERHYSEIIYDREEGTLTFDRTYSGIRKDSITARSMKVREENNELNLRILIDKYSVEIFANGGEQAMTSLVYTDVNATKMTFASDGKAYMDIKKYEIEVK